MSDYASDYPKILAWTDGAFEVPGRHPEWFHEQAIVQLDDDYVQIAYARARPAGNGYERVREYLETVEDLLPLTWLTLPAFARVLEAIEETAEADVYSYRPIVLATTRPDDYADRVSPTISVPYEQRVVQIGRTIIVEDSETQMPPIRTWLPDRAAVEGIKWLSRNERRKIDDAMHDRNVQVATDLTDLADDAFLVLDEAWDRVAPIRLQLSDTGLVRVGVVGDEMSLINTTVAVSASHGRTLSWPIPGGATPASIGDFIDHHMPQLRAVHAGHVNQRLDDGGQVAYDDITQRISSAVADGSLRYVDYRLPNELIDAGGHGFRLQDAAAIRARAQAQGWVVAGGEEALLRAMLARHGEGRLPRERDEATGRELALPKGW